MLSYVEVGVIQFILGTWKAMFFNWSREYPGTLERENMLKNVWLVLPKFLCWKICLARNKMIFAGENQMTNQIADNSISMTAYVYKIQRKQAWKNRYDGNKALKGLGKN